MASYVLRAIDPDLWREVRRQAAAEGVPVTAIVEQLLRAWIARARAQEDVDAGANPPAARGPGEVL